MRVLFDTNVLISYLLPFSRSTTTQRIVEDTIHSSITIILPEELVAELSQKVADKKYLAERIPAENAARFIRALTDVAEAIPPIVERVPEVGRDRKDDYLLAYALVGRADYLVSGDDDLLVLREVEDLKIVSPAEFARILEEGRAQEGAGSFDSRL